MDVIILDGNQRSALAVTRSLGKKGLNINVGAETPGSLAASSKYCNHSFSYPSPYQSGDNFFLSICRQISRYKQPVIIPMADVTISEILERREKMLGSATIPFVEYDQYRAASDKLHVFKLSRDLDVAAPKTVFSDECRNREDIALKSQAIGFPLVVKPGRSRIRTGTGWSNASVCYAHNKAEFSALLDREPFKSHPFLVQEKIEGPGIGIFFLMKQGEVLVRFAHARIREKPPSGGVSVLCESIQPPVEASKSAEQLLKRFNWYGVAMVEFKWDKRDNTAKLMEINARFWGSLELAIAAGVNFPYLLYRLATDQKIDPINNYRTGIRSRWELGDLDHLLVRMRKRNIFLPADAPSRLELVKDFALDFFRSSIRHEVLQRDDPGPFLFEARHYLAQIF